MAKRYDFLGGRPSFTPAKPGDLDDIRTWLHGPPAAIEANDHERAPRMQRLASSRKRKCRVGNPLGINPCHSALRRNTRRTGHPS